MSEYQVESLLQQTYDANHDGFFRTGKWTMEEENFASKLIELFHAGQIYAGVYEGQTLRSYLARRLKCKPMRISKKFPGQNILSDRYHRSEIFWDACTSTSIVHDLEKIFLAKDVVVRFEREKRKKYYTKPSSEKNMTKKRKVNICSDFWTFAEEGMLDTSTKCEDTIAVADLISNADILSTIQPINF
mmetsp:Transcript_26594/g.26841  ORF Transcript_26594/g.26841 Transcript_26594/m.26841 type:complete len:188 (+) Transcript_26594:79-642(+)|eukprot:CAMPEP_0182426244 /NCGR_PEP_ID=MMETSP1167-20130531/12738_1 /TAXON_ID=2988 /ORGANISM="Mallomonas Sp, Strain CCMP3275" /LENGTH=187 /DNA_ID=CAMNT_0024607545 /DNA_START=58 /DNA_END=621 /DNA_ORIENTATION=-